MNRFVLLRYQLSQDIITNVLIIAARIIVKFWHTWVHTCCVDSLVNHGADSAYVSASILGWPLVKISVAMMDFIGVCTMHRVINVSCIVYMFCFTFWTTLWWDSILTWIQGRQIMVNSCYSKGNQCLVDSINQGLIIHSNLWYTIEVCPVNDMHHFSPCHWNLGLLKRLTRQQFNWKQTLNVRYECFWGMSTCSCLNARLPFFCSL